MHNKVRDGSIRNFIHSSEIQFENSASVDHQDELIDSNCSPTTSVKSLGTKHDTSEQPVTECFSRYRLSLMPSRETRDSTRTTYRTNLVQSITSESGFESLD